MCERAAFAAEAAERSSEELVELDDADFVDFDSAGGLAPRSEEGRRARAGGAPPQGKAPAETGGVESELSG
eukprot:14157670-Alexandrium_andersonii.AAC.1